MAENTSSNPTPISPIKPQEPGHVIYVGTFEALEAQWAAWVESRQLNDPLREINVLVGSNILATYLKRRFARSGRPLMNVRFHTFLDIANRLAEGSPGRGRKPWLPLLGSAVILEEVLASNAATLFAPLSDLPGFRAALLETFRDLRDADIAAAELLKAVKSDPRMKERRQQLAAFAGLFRDYRERVERFRDVDDVFREAIRNVSRAAESFASRELIVYGIYDTTEQQSRLLGALKDVFDMNYFIPYAGQETAEFAEPFLNARVVELGVEPVRLSQTKAVFRSLDRLAARSFGLGRSPGSDLGGGLPPDGSFALVSVPGESRAAIEIVREIFRAVQDGTIRGFHEAAVILRQPETEIPILSETFRLRGVPFFIHGGVRFSERPLCKAIRCIAELEAEGCSREAVLSTMEMIAASLPPSKDGWDVQAWRALTNDSRFLAGIESWDEGTRALVAECRRSLKRVEAGERPDPDDENGRGGEDVLAAADRLASASALREGWQRLRNAAANWPDVLTWAGWADYLEEHLWPILGEAEDWDTFTTVLDEIRNLQVLEPCMVGNRPAQSSPEGVKGEWLIPAERLRAILVQAMESFSTPSGRFERSGVNLLSTSAARGLRFPLVIIPGLDEGRFPAKLRQDPFLLDSERRWIGRLPLKSERQKEEKLLFAMACNSAEKRLVLMTSRLDESSDREKIPSQFFLRVAAAARGKVISLRDLVPGIIPGFRSVGLDNLAPPDDEVAVDEGEIRLRLILSGGAPADSVLQALTQLDPIRLKGPLAYDRARWDRRLTSYDGCFSKPKLIGWVAGKLGAEAGPVSASMIEEYAKCPYFFYLKRGMGLTAWEEPVFQEGMDPLERGSAIHAILESFLKDYRGDRFLQVSKNELRERLAILARQTLEESRPAGIPDLLWEIELASLLNLLDKWIDFEKDRADGGVLPSGLEESFGEMVSGEKRPPLRLQAGKYAYEFRGRIDRVDVSPDGSRARVVDYKTGSLPNSMGKTAPKNLMGGERVQLVVYRLALSTLNAYMNAKEVEGEYLYLQPRDGKVKACQFSTGELQKAAEDLPRILQVMGEGMEGGAYFAKTSGVVHPDGHCNFCDFLPICGKDRQQREERKMKDPAVRKFLRMREDSE